MKSRLFGQESTNVFEDPEVAEHSEDTSSEFLKMLDSSNSKSFASVNRGDQVSAKMIRKTADGILFDVGQRSEGYLVTDALSEEELGRFEEGKTYQLYVVSVRNGIELGASLSEKQAGLDGLRQAYESSLPVMGKVVSENKGGYSVELAGAKGFCPFSQMDVVSGKPPAAYIGQSFKFIVTKFSGRDVVLSRSSLIRQEQEVEQKKLLEQLEVGAVVKATVTKFESFGAFVDLGGGLTALVPNSELSWARGMNAHSLLTLGETVMAKVIKIEPSLGRTKIACSLKQVEGDPWDYLVNEFDTGQIHTVTITKLMAFGAFAELKPGIEGLIHISEMSSKRRISTPGELVKVGDKVTTQIVSIDRMSRKIGLSMKATDQGYVAEQEQKKILDEKTKQDEHRGVEFVTKAATSTLGEAFKKAIQKR